MNAHSHTPATPKTFDTFWEAFEYCRYKGHPVTVLIDDGTDESGKWKLYPSGGAKRLTSKGEPK